jgi:hypothetical protein
MNQRYTVLGILSVFRAYLKAVFVDGIHKVYTFFDALGIAFYFFPGLDEWLSVIHQDIVENRGTLTDKRAIRTS